MNIDYGKRHKRKWEEDQDEEGGGREGDEKRQALQQVGSHLSLIGIHPSQKHPSIASYLSLITTRSDPFLCPQTDPTAESGRNLVSQSDIHCAGIGART